MPKLCFIMPELCFYAAIMLFMPHDALMPQLCFYAADLRIWPPEFFLPVFGRIGASCLRVPRAMFVREFFGSTHYATFRGSRETVKRSIVMITDLCLRQVRLIMRSSFIPCMNDLGINIEHVNTVYGRGMSPSDILSIEALS